MWLPQENPNEEVKNFVADRSVYVLSEVMEIVDDFADNVVERVKRHFKDIVMAELQGSLFLHSVRKSTAEMEIAKFLGGNTARVLASSVAQGHVFEETDRILARLEEKLKKSDRMMRDIEGRIERIVARFENRSA